MFGSFFKQYKVKTTTKLTEHNDTRDENIVHCLPLLLLLNLLKTSVTPVNLHNQMTYFYKFVAV